MPREIARSKFAVRGVRTLSVLLLLMSGAATSAAGRKTDNAQKLQPRRAYSIALPPKPDFSALDWLVGEWAGKTLGKDSPGDVHLDAAYALNRQYVIINEWIALPATKSAPATREAWMNILDASGSGLVLQSYSSTGFVLRYRVLVQPDRLEFFPDGGERAPAGWLFRRTLSRVASNTISESVEAAPPGRPFFEYYTARLSRVAPSSPTTPGPPPAASSSPKATVPAPEKAPSAPPAKDNQASPQ